MYLKDVMELLERVCLEGYYNSENITMIEWLVLFKEDLQLLTNSLIFSDSEVTWLTFCFEEQESKKQLILKRDDQIYNFFWDFNDHATGYWSLGIDKKYIISGSIHEIIEYVKGLQIQSMCRILFLDCQPEYYQMLQIY